MDVYNKIRSLAKKKKIPITELERRSGLGNGTIGRWNESSPTLDNLSKVAKVLNVPIQKLIK